MSEHAPEKDQLIDLHHILPQLRALDWSHGLTRDQVRARLGDFPAGVYLLLPSEREFRGPEDLVRFYRRAWVRSHQEGIPASGAAEDGGPAAWGPSPPATGARAVGGRHGVGSGADSGYTGSDDVGTDRSGASYGPHSREPEIESGLG